MGGDSDDESGASFEAGQRAVALRIRCDGGYNDTTQHAARPGGDGIDE
jgi:hypothetical protein